MQGQPKRNTLIVQAEAQHRPQDKPKERLRRSRTPAIRARPRLAGNAGLFDRHGEPPDQPRDFVQMVGIVLRDGLCKPNEALVITHLGGVWNGRRSWPYREGPDVWHRITSWRIPAPSSVRCEYVFLGLGPQRSRGAGSPGSAPDRIFRVVKNGNKSLPRRQFASAIEVACERPISRFARLWGFVIRSPSRPMGFRLFLGSSAVEHSTVNRMVAGSNPARGASYMFQVTSHCIKTPVKPASTDRFVCQAVSACITLFQR